MFLFNIILIITQITNQVKVTRTGKIATFFLSPNILLSQRRIGTRNPLGLFPASLGLVSLTFNYILIHKTRRGCKYQIFIEVPSGPGMSRGETLNKHR